MRGKPIVTIRLSNEEITALRLEATKNGITVSDIIRAAIARYLDENNTKPA